MWGEKGGEESEEREKKRGFQETDHRKEKLQSLDFIWSEMENHSWFMKWGVTRELIGEECRRFQSKDTS